MKVPFCDLTPMHKKLSRKINSSIKRVINNSAFILGNEVNTFEQEFSNYLGVDYFIGTSNGTAALMVALKALDIGNNDEVILPAMSFYATAEAVAFIGAKPVFVDIDPLTCNINISQIEEKISNKTKLILPVHLYGYPANLDEIIKIGERFNLKILTDCAHATGATYKGRKVGAIEDIAAFSFYPSKNLGCIGEAGGIATNDKELAELCRKYRDHGSTKKFEHTHIGINARMDGINAAVLSVKLKYLDEWNLDRLRIAGKYSDIISGLNIETQKVEKNYSHVFHIYQIQIKNRDYVLAKMQEKGIGVNIHYPVPLHLHKGFSFLNYKKGDFPVAEQLAEETLSLPVYPYMKDIQVEYVCKVLKSLI
jgi:UDP-2-acetamido-2-deoxy-ribo-hexuluronate aminotransferase